VGSEYQVVVTRISGRDQMTIKVERGASANRFDDEAIVRSLEEEIRRSLLVRGKVEIVDYGCLPRTERKSKRVFDERNNS
jgi:phenylacetate-CoA ligase